MGAADGRNLLGILQGHPRSAVPTLSGAELCLRILFLQNMALWCKVHYMNPHWAEENLQTIRTLMERSALYRRALAPIMLFAGVMGTLAAAAGLFFHLNSQRAFHGLWLGTAIVVVIRAFFIARKQAIKDGEELWSLPTRRVAQALAPPLVAGFIAGVMFFWLATYWNAFTEISPLIWALLYGCALHSAGFFMSRGVKLFGWIYIVLVPFVVIALVKIQPIYINPHWIMGFFFGVLHLAYGGYLSFTERKNAA